MRSGIFALALAALMVGFFLGLPAAFSAQEAPLPEECEALQVWETTREQRIEQEFHRRGITDPLDKGMRRAEVERVIDERIRTLRELCASKKT